ncbi:MAG: virulence RhuM family protein [Bacteroidales bacterium]|nr:virulence RhuM family protein [Bacteroidales bacterium]
MTENNEIVMYQPDETIKLEVRLENDTVWLNAAQMANLFNRDEKTVRKHISNALKEELSDTVFVEKFATTTQHGAMEGKFQIHEVSFYNLDVIISVGYRVKSQRGVEFRRWATRVLKEYLLKGYSINQRLERLEQRVTQTENKIDFFVKTSLPPVEGIFYDGQIFDAYKFANDLIRSAKQRIILIDNYIDDTVLQMLDKRLPNISATIYTKTITPQLQLDLQRHNAQYAPISIQQFANAHDRFLLIDNTVYHIGASLKDLGKKWFAFSKMSITANELVGKM